MPANARGGRTGGEGCVRAAPRESSTASSNRLHANADASPCQTSLPLLAFQKRHEMTIQPASTRRLGMCARTKYVLRYCECTPPATPGTQEATFVSVGASELVAAQRVAAACAAWIQAARRGVDIVLWIAAPTQERGLRREGRPVTARDTRRVGRSDFRCESPGVSDLPCFFG